MLSLCQALNSFESIQVVNTDLPPVKASINCPALLLIKISHVLNANRLFLSLLLTDFVVCCRIRRGWFGIMGEQGALPGIPTDRWVYAV